MEKILKIEGMSCIKCIAFIKEILSEIKGIDRVVNVEIGKITIISNDEFDENEMVKVLLEEEFRVISII
ncbi:MAG: heavy-metal-associated domain-containing protein [Fusobacteriaceae bacterium]